MYPQLAGLSVKQLALFTRLLSVLRNDILLVQPARLSSQRAPSALPPSIIEFISLAVGVNKDRVPVLWKELKGEVWEMEPAMLGEDEEALFRNLLDTLSTKSLLPERGMHSSNHAQRLQDGQVVVYTVDKGVMPAHSIQLHCPQCHTGYHPDYYVHGGLRTYYTDHMPNYIQIGAHQFIEKKLVSLWTSLLLVAWVSASNFSKCYDMALSGQKENDFAQGGWQFGCLMTTDHVYDAFVIVSLLEHHSKHDTQLVVPHKGEQKDRYTAAMEARNKDIVANGQDAIDHACDTCLRTCVYEDGEEVDIQPIVSDGIAIGHPRCGVPGGGCTNPLSSNRNRFCDEHVSFEKKCAVVPCYREIVPGTKSCDDPIHIAMERQHCARGQAAFTLTERLQRHREAHPTNEEDEGLPEVDDAEDVESFEQDAEGNIKIRSEKNPGSVGVEDDPRCGDEVVQAEGAIRPGRASMYHAEAVSNVLLFTQKAFSVPRARKPNFLIYDTACDAQQQVFAHPKEWSWFHDVKCPWTSSTSLTSTASITSFVKSTATPPTSPSCLDRTASGISIPR
ncbi:hypothetical protein HMN09_00932200 [Mycena chlorophos]|uniref:CxC6 like cysteine cluster associated with KDZ domain-containing protein n=1 Tax=Mycena chlorophos TaxID=658473 RepID=A0A8H6SKH7_MYCCL|nr:hypothetical protein HMN09_00932200 [Mycena chlorophos]